MLLSMKYGNLELKMLNEHEIDFGHENMLLCIKMEMWIWNMLLSIKYEFWYLKSAVEHNMVFEFGKCPCGLKLHFMHENGILDLLEWIWSLRMAFDANCLAWTWLDMWWYENGRTRPNLNWKQFISFENPELVSGHPATPLVRGWLRHQVTSPMWVWIGMCAWITNHPSFIWSWFLDVRPLHPLGIENGIGAWITSHPTWFEMKTGLVHGHPSHPTWFEIRNGAAVSTWLYGRTWIHGSLHLDLAWIWLAWIWIDLNLILDFDKL